MWIGAEPPRGWLDDRIDERDGCICAIIPAYGHSIEGAAPGEWGIVTWRNIDRRRPNCGQPAVRGIITNGGGIFHDAPLSITGVSLPEGITREFAYKFYVNEQAHCGHAEFRVEVTFPKAENGAPPALNP